MQIRMFNKLFSLDNRPKVRFHNFNKERQYKRQPYIIEVYFNNKAFILHISPFCIEYTKTYLGYDHSLIMPRFMLSYVKYKRYQDDGRYESEWGNLVEDEPF